MRTNIAIFERLCPICGRRFAFSCRVVDWVYNIHNNRKRSLYCSYTCMQEAKMRIRAKRKRKDCRSKF